MRYTYKCDRCLNEVEVSHQMGNEPTIICKQCGEEMRVKITPPSHIIMSTVGNRSVLRRDTPSNREYQAYKNWEDAGGQPGTKEHKRYLEERGYD